MGIIILKIMKYNFILLKKIRFFLNFIKRNKFINVKNLRRKDYI